MKKLAIAIIAAVLSIGAAQAQDRIQVGRLSCDVEGGVGLLIGSSKALECTFHRDGRAPQHYAGSIDKLGLDIGITGRTHIEWLVFAATNTPVNARSLAGTYVGASGEATLGLGLGANWLIGGSRNSFALQPWSIQGQTGINLSATWSRLTLN